ncbi:hypothetical protein V1512DRAFT_256086 [Lipomyces arxii]|uniref:uncharacterized protein n=1 Tax=Lipomyces arxii TaxID=56418 RepID=UPI0034CFBF4E
MKERNGSGSSRHSSTASLTIHALPRQILLPMMDRPNEMNALVNYNTTFFSQLESALGPAYRENLLPLFSTTRDRIDDATFLESARRIFGDSSCLGRTWIEFCRIVGCDDESVITPETSPSRKSSEQQRESDTLNTRKESLEFANPFSKNHRKTASDSSSLSLSPLMTFADPIQEE